MKRFTEALCIPAMLSSLFIASAGLALAQVGFKMVEGDHAAISINGQPFSDFYFGTAYPKPYLAPLRAPTGQIVTRKFPMEKVAGESNDHPHHRGLFVGYGSISGVNFWENEFAYKTSNRGKIVMTHMDDPKPGQTSGSLTMKFEWRGPSGTVMMDELRTMTFFAEPKEHVGSEERIVDVDMTFTPRVALKFDDTKEGFFAVRLADSLAEKNGGLMTNSQGAQTEKNVWGKRADWVDYDGTVEGQKVGIVIFDHPQNRNHSPRWHSRAYGLFAVNPFGQKDFDKAAPGEGGLSLSAGDTMRLRYRVIIHQGDIPMKKISEWYAEYQRVSSK